MNNKPIAIIRITGPQQQSTAIIYNNLNEEARKYFSYILHDNHKYAKRRAQQEASTLAIGDTYTANDSTYWLSEIIDTRNL